MNITLKNLGAKNAAQNGQLAALVDRLRYPRTLFDVEPLEDRYIVRFRLSPINSQNLKRWFRQQGHSARRDYSKELGDHWYVKCSRDVALLAKVTFGGN